MAIIEVIQGSEEWLELRYSKITATDIGSIIDVNPHKNATTLWNQKLKLVEPEKVNERMLRGQKLEEPAREMLCDITGITFKPAVIISDKYSWALSSLDGLSECMSYICEIKAMNEDGHRLALEGQIKPYYTSQMQWQLMCSGADKCYFFSYRPECSQPYALIEVLPDLEYQEKIISAGQQFYIELCTMQPPKVFQLKKKE